MRLLAALVAIAASSPALAGTALPGIALEGDPELVERIGVALAQRGIALDATSERTARIERRGGELVISIAEPSHAPVERTVREVRTAAAVIESFVRDDVGSPLLAIRVPVRPRVVVETETPPAHGQLPTGTHLFAGLETSIASDGTPWMGAQLGACVMLGPLCASVRVRGNTVASEEGLWSTTRRKSSELLFGFDVPFSLGRFLLTPGVAAGYGGMSTRESSQDANNRSNGARAEVHAAFSVPLTRSLALDLSVAGTLVQQVEREVGYMSTVPEEPLGYLRFGVAMRYGDR